MNSDIKAIIKKSGLYQWEIAEYLDMSETTFCRKMRHPLEPDFRDAVIQAIQEVAHRKVAAKIQSTGSPFVVEKGGTIGECTM